MNNNHIHLASFPRSGNKFAQQILHHVFGLKCRSIYRVPEYSDEIAPTWDGIEQDVIVKTHELWSSGSAICIVRDPRDVYCSYAKYLSHVKRRSVTPAELIQCTSWSEHVLSWQQPSVHVVKYEDLLRDPIAIMKAVCERLTIAVTEIGTIPMWTQLHADCPWYYQRGDSGRWRTELTKSEIALCEAKNHACMKTFGYASQEISD